MTKTRKLLSLVLALALTVALFGVAGCGSKPEEPEKPTGTEEPADLGTLTPGVIIVGSDTAYPPFESVDNGKIVGFDIDLMSAIGDILEHKVEFKTYKFDSLITGLQANTEFDMAASAMTITEERAQKVNFSDPYINSNQSLTVSVNSSIQSVDDLKRGDKVGVQSGTTGEIWSRENLEPKGVVVTPYDDTLAAFGALAAGDVVGIINDIPISQFIVADEARQAKVVAEIETGEQYGFAFNKENTALRDAVNDALAEVKANGTYAKIYKTWFGAEPTSIP